MHIWKSEVHKYLYYPELTFLVRVSQNLKFVVSVRLAGQQTPGNLSVSASQWLVSQTDTAMLGLYVGAGGFELGSSCLCSRLFAH